MSEQRGVDRRTFIKYTGLATLGGALYTGGLPALPALAAGPEVSGTISGTKSYPDGFVVPAGKTLTFDPDVSTTVTVSGNVIVEGTLRMKPSSKAIVHLLKFEGIDESKFVGRGIFETRDEIPVTDVGLWVIGAGKLDIEGTRRTAWNRTGDDPTWESTDELVVTPTAPGDYGAGGFKKFTKGSAVPKVSNPYGGPGALGAAFFTDTASSTFRADIDKIAAAGITKGCNPPANTLFCPNDLVTRGQMAAFLARALELPAAGSAGFKDTKGHTFEADIDKLAAAGITKGCNPPANDLFCPDDFVTRGQMAAFLARALELPAAGSAGFKDTKGHTFEADIDKLAAAGITKGCNPPANDLFCPDDFVTRGQMAAFLARALKLPTASADTAWTAEVLNLTRNVRIEGTPSGRTHISIHSSVPQSIKYLAVRHFGPRGFTLAQTEDGVGRYGLHFHHCGDGSRGSIVEGVVVRDGGNHAFVPHASHGITMRDCISYNTNEDAYWWDEHVENASNNVLWERCVAALVNHEDSDGYRLAGFALMASEDPHTDKSDPNVNTIRDCVAVGVNGARDSAGIVWPEFASGAVWDFSGNVSHNNSQSGIFTWQNDGNDHDNHDFVCYHNGAHGINHGAYVNTHHYSNGVLYGNGVSGIYLRAANLREIGKSGTELAFTNMVIDGAGISDHCVTHGEHTSLPPLIRKPIVFEDCVLTGSVGAKVYVTNPAQNNGDPSNLLKDRWDFVDCGLSKSDVVVTSDADPDALVRVQNGSTAFEVDSTGARDLAPFA